MYLKNNSNLILQNSFNINDLPFIKDRTFNEIKIRYYELHSTAYDACLDISYMLLRIDYILDYMLKNYADIGKKEIKDKLKEIEFYTKKPLENYIKLNQMVVRGDK